MDNNNTIKVLHLSDLHFGYQPNQEDAVNANQELINNSFLDYFSILKKEHNIDFILITGDVSEKGLKKDFDLAEIFFNKLIENMPDTKVLFCKGNHDVKVTGSQDHNDFFYKFCEKYNPKVKKPYNLYHDDKTNISFVTLDDYISVNEVKKRINKKNVKFNLEHGEVSQILKNIKSKKPSLVITLMHFPYYFFLNENITQTNYFLTSFDIVKSFSDILLTGHLHGSIEKPDILSYKTLCFYGGIICDKGRGDKLSCSLLKINIQEKTVEKRTYNYDSGNWGQFSGTNTYSYEIALPNSMELQQKVTQKI